MEGTKMPDMMPENKTRDSSEGQDDSHISRSTSETLTRHPTELYNDTYETRPNEQHPDETLSKATSVISRIPTASKNPEFGLPREIAFVSTVISAQLLTQACLAIAIAPAHVIGESFNVTNPGQLSWLAAGFSLTVGTFIMPSGRWGDLFGHKKLLVSGYLWLAGWSLIAGFSVWSHNLPFFAFCRAMQGIGSAIILPNGIAVLARTYPPGPRKDMVLSLFGATAPGGYVLGAVFSGLLTELVWWPWSYWILGIVAGLLGVLAVLVVPKMPVFGERPSLKELDPWGTVLGVGGLVMFNFAWNEGPTAGWGKVYVYVLLIIGLILLVAFVLFERFKAEYPLLPVAAFTRDTNLVFGCIAAGWASFGIWVYYFWQFLEVLEGDSILLAAAKGTPTAISGAIAAIVTGFLISRIQPGYIMLISMTAFLTGTLLVATNPVGRSYWAQLFVSTIIICWGMDMSFPSSVIALSNHMPPEQQGVAASLVNTVINYSISIGLGIAGTVETHVNDGGRDILKGYRGAWYVGIGLDSLGIVLAVGLILSWRSTTNAREKAEAEKSLA